MWPHRFPLISLVLSDSTFFCFVLFCLLLHYKNAVIDIKQKNAVQWKFLKSGTDGNVWCIIFSKVWLEINEVVSNGYSQLARCFLKKMSAHAAPCRAVGVFFIPLAIESLGGWSELAAKSISRIGCLLGQRLGMSPSITSCQWCSVSLWRGNAAMWPHCFPLISLYTDSIVWLHVFLFCVVLSFAYLVVFCFLPALCFALFLFVCFFVKLA